MATSSSPQSDQTLKVEDEKELADMASTTILMVAGVHDELHPIDASLLKMSPPTHALSSKFCDKSVDRPTELCKGSDKGDNKIDSLTMEPSDTFLMGDEVISTTLERENNEFVKSSVDDLVPILKESEVKSVYDDLECDMPITIPLPTTNVREENFDINSPLGEYVEFEDISSLDPHVSTPVIDESSLLVTLLPDSEQICLKEVEIFDHFFSLTRSGGTTRVMETPSFGFHHMPSPRPVAYSPTEVMYCYYHPHLTSGDGFDHGPKMK
nr:NAC domain-containing protein [Tanacetum cinerariifolium]